MDCQTEKEMFVYLLLLCTVDIVKYYKLCFFFVRSYVGSEAPFIATGTLVDLGTSSQVN